MKARTPDKIYCSHKAVEQAVRKERQIHLRNEYDKIVKDISYQTLAVVFDCLNKEFGFGEKRLKQLKNSVEESFILMDIGVFGRKYDTLDVVKSLKQKFGIDFEQSMYDEIGGIQK